ncbi:MAG: helix-hairpin-helix domain-containing protein [Anaerotruncus sp.]|nr:MAG: helix-hairpin-helix domain-containing protein [Anaerotruncus sp.]
MTVSAGDDAVTVVGNSLPVAEGVQIEACGEWVMHPTFGRQLKADSIKLTMPENAAGMLNYLSSGIVRGIGPATASKIVDEFGAETFDVLQNDLNRLASIKGISRTKAREMQKNRLMKNMRLARNSCRSHK